MRFFKPGWMPQLYSPVTKTKPSALRILPGERFQRRRRFALRIFLVHAVEHRQADRLGVDQLDIVAARAQAVDDEIRKANAHAVGPVGTVEHENAIAHAAEYHDAAQLRRNTLR